MPVFREAVSKPFANVWISLAYTFNNLLYFDALSSISAVTYQVLSQSKTFFTAGLMRFLVGKKLTPRQLLAIIMLVTALSWYSSRSSPSSPCPPPPRRQAPSTGRAGW